MDVAIIIRKGSLVPDHHGFRRESKVRPERHLESKSLGISFIVTAGEASKKELDDRGMRRLPEVIDDVVHFKDGSDTRKIDTFNGLRSQQANTAHDREIVGDGIRRVPFTMGNAINIQACCRLSRDVAVL